MMKRIFFILSSCLILSACSNNERVFYQENCFITETQITEDMRKIIDIMSEYHSKEIKAENEQNLKLTKVICKLFGKNNKLLNKEVDKILKFYNDRNHQNHKKRSEKDLKNALKGLKLDYKQVVLLATELEKKYAEIDAENRKLFAPYKDRALEIIKIIEEKRAKKDDWGYSYYENDLELTKALIIEFKMKEVVKSNYNKSLTYASIIHNLLDYINNNTLVDSFLAQHTSAVFPKDEDSFEIYTSVWSIIPNTDTREVLIFDSVKNAINNKNISKEELQEVALRLQNCMASLASLIKQIQYNVIDNIEHETDQYQYREKMYYNFGIFGSSSRYCITKLVCNYPALEDFEKEIEKLAERLAYKTYYKININRFLYSELRKTYSKSIEELFKNAPVLADKLYSMIKYEKISEDSTEKRRYKHTLNMKSVATIKELAKIGAKKILSEPDCYIDSRKDIENAFKKRFRLMRENYLKNMREESAD